MNRLAFITQKSFDYYRIYYMAITRPGGIIQLPAFELNPPGRTTPLVIRSGPRLTRNWGLISALGPNRSPPDVIGSVAVTLRPGWPFREL